VSLKSDRSKLPNPLKALIVPAKKSHFDTELHNSSYTTRKCAETHSIDDKRPKLSFIDDKSKVGPSRNLDEINLFILHGKFSIGVPKSKWVYRD